MNESQGSSLAGRRAPVPRAVLGCALGVAFAIVLSGCGQKGPLFLPAPGRPGGAARAPSAPEDSRPAAPVAPLPDTSSPGLPPAAR